MDGSTSFSPVRPPGSECLSTSTPKMDERCTPPRKRLPPHLRLRLMRQQEEAAAALEAQKRKTTATVPNVPSSSQEEPPWKPTTSSPPRPPVLPTEPLPASPSSEASSERAPPDGGAFITQHRRVNGRLTPPIFSPVQENTVDDEEKTDNIATEAVPKLVTTTGFHPAAVVQQEPPRPSTPIHLQTPPLPQQTDTPQSLKKEDVVDKENLHPVQKTTIPPCGTVEENHQIFVENVSESGTSSNCDPDVVNVWDCDASEKDSPPQSVKSSVDPSTMANAEEPEPAHYPTTTERAIDETRRQKSLFNTVEEDSVFVEPLSLRPAKNQTHTPQDSTKSPDAPTVFSEVRAKSTKATPIPSPTPTIPSPKKDTVHPEARPESVHRSIRNNGLKSASSIATNENVNFTGEDIEVVHAIPRPRQYPNPPADGNVPGYPDPLRAHPVDVFWDGSTPASAVAPAGAAVSAQVAVSSESALEMTRESRTAMWAQRMRRFRTTDVVGGRAEALRDESQVHHDFYGYPLPIPSDTTGATSKAAITAVTAGDGPVGVMGMSGGNGRDAGDRGGPELDPMSYPPMEPTGPLYRMRMVILSNFAARCREAKHRVEVTAQPVVEREGERAAIERRHGRGLARGRQGRTSSDETAASVPAPTAPTKEGPCPQCSLADAFTMRAQHGQLFLESMLLPLSETTTYADMVSHVNTHVAERIYADAGMGNARADDPAYPWEDIQAMPVYEDYQGALVLASHRRRVMEDLPMVVDDAGMIKGVK